MTPSRRHLTDLDSPRPRRMTRRHLRPLDPRRHPFVWSTRIAPMRPRRGDGSMLVHPRPAPERGC